MTQSTELPSAGDDEQVRLEPDQHEMEAPARECIERAFVDSLAQFAELYWHLPLYPWVNIRVHPMAQHPNDPRALGID